MTDYESSGRRQLLRSTRLSTSHQRQCIGDGGSGHLRGASTGDGEDGLPYRGARADGVGTDR